MTAIAPTGFAAPPALGPAVILQVPPPSATEGALPTPLLDGLDPRDALSVMLMSIERSSQTSMATSEQKIRATKKDISAQLDEYLTKLRDAIQAAKEEEDDGGWFGSIVSCVADVVGSIVGAIADVFCDYVAFPIEATVDIATNLGNAQAMMSALASDVADFGKTGEAGQAVKGFASGVTKFAADVAVFQAKLAVAMGKAAATGGDVLDAVKDDLKQLGKSLDKNIISNPDFWKVVSAAAKVAAVAGAVATGGALAVACVALMALDELDSRTGIIARAVGPDAAPWVRAGVKIGAAVAGGLAAGGAPAGVARTFEKGTQIVEGAGIVAAGVRAKIAADKEGDELDRQADLTATLNRMQQLQRLCEDLLDTLTDKNKDHTTNQELGSELVQTQSATELAAVVQG
jgi:hypothetical protein